MSRVEEYIIDVKCDWIKNLEKEVRDQENIGFGDG